MLTNSGFCAKFYFLSVTPHHFSLPIFTLHVKLLYTAAFLELVF